jgi:hypothetical protein
MSLELVINEKTITSRKSLLSNYLKNNNVGILTENEGIFFKHIFQKFYTPDNEDIKFNVGQISNVSIKKNRGNKCFSILVDNIWYPTSIKPLSGSIRNENRERTRALRNAIEPQINNFRVCNPLKPNDICPVTNKILDIDAQVDHHQKPFHILAEEWLKDNNNISCPYDLDKFDYILQEPHLTSWFNFHLEKSTLRWVSKEGNKYAHKL